MNPEDFALLEEMIKRKDHSLNLRLEKLISRLNDVEKELKQLKMVTGPGMFSGGRYG